MTVSPDWAALRLGSLELVAAAGVFVYAGWRRRSAAGHADPALPASHEVELRVETAGGAELKRLPLPLTIGRSAAAGLVVRDPHVSRLHARIDAADGEVRLCDLESRNGTSVNARPIEGSVTLKPGDEIRIGRARIVFRGVGLWK
jgi:hypothetical protein